MPDDGPDLMDVVFCCFTHRCMMNYAPVLEMVERRGGRVSLAIFPRVCDPDHRGLYATGFEVISHHPIDREGRLLSGSIARIVDEIGDPDLLLLGTCNLGPERVIGGLARAGCAVGLQHGFYQDWEDYDSNPARPVIGVCGPMFRHRIAKRSVVLGLPKLDLVPAIPPNPGGDIVYAGQYSNRPDDLLRTLLDLQRVSGRRVVVRPHPEGRAHLDMLRASLAFSDPEEPLADCMRRAALVLTTGSTVVLEALVADVPVVVLPDCHGWLYEPAGVVADDFSAEAVIRVWTAAPERAALTGRFLADYTGSALPDRTERAYRALTGLAGRA